MNEVEELLNHLTDKIEVMNEFPPYKEGGSGLEGLARLGYLRAVNELAQWLLSEQIGRVRK